MQGKVTQILIDLKLKLLSESDGINQNIQEDCPKCDISRKIGLPKCSQCDKIL